MISKLEYHRILGDNPEILPVTKPEPQKKPGEDLSISDSLAGNKDALSADKTIPAETSSGDVLPQGDTFQSGDVKPSDKKPGGDEIVISPETRQLMASVLYAAANDALRTDTEEETNTDAETDIQPEPNAPSETNLPAEDVSVSETNSSTAGNPPGGISELYDRYMSALAEELTAVTDTDQGGSLSRFLEAETGDSGWAQHITDDNTLYEMDENGNITVTDDNGNERTIHSGLNPDMVKSNYLPEIVKKIENGETPFSNTENDEADTAGIQAEINRLENEMNNIQPQIPPRYN